ncbi:hypothetical protein [Mycetocola saprophilus]|uniref:hypothetical protein n=1 Tax=Mycetocola saprophilus TaxID=76636 RepID=UPI0004C15AD4|nr:hypothetical protein [Mycetocola saprophilus]
MSVLSETAVPDALAAQIAGNGWASTASGGTGGANMCTSPPSFVGPLATFVQPLLSLLDQVSGQPAAVYQASMRWESTTGDVASIRDALKAQANAVEGQLEGLTAEALALALKMVSSGAHSVSNWTKSVAQALQLCVTIFETVRSLVCEALLNLANFASTVADLVFGSMPWELEKKAETISKFTRSVQRFVNSCAAAMNNALKAARELVRLITDLFRAIVPFHAAIDAAIGQIVNSIPGGDPVSVAPGGERRGPNGSIENPSQTPYPGSELAFTDKYPRGYQHSYDLGPSDLTTEELNKLFRDEFGHIFVPSRVGDNSQLNAQLTHVNQRIQTSLFGTSIPEVTTGGIVVNQIAPDGFTVRAEDGHPEAPGEVAFRITSENGRARLQVTGAYADTIIGKHDLGAPVESNPAFAGIADVSIWSDMQGRFRDRLKYGR